MASRLGADPDRFRKAPVLIENHVYARNAAKLSVAFRMLRMTRRAPDRCTAYGLAPADRTVRDGAGIHHNQVGIGRGSGFVIDRRLSPWLARIGLIAAAPEGTSEKLRHPRLP